MGMGVVQRLTQRADPQHQGVMASEGQQLLVRSQRLSSILLAQLWVGKFNDLSVGPTNRAAHCPDLRPNIWDHCGG
jgi:hypothetical protein